MTAARTTRRHLLRAAGSAGLLLPFGELLRPQPGRANQEGPPRRLLVLDMPNAVWRSDWLPNGGRMVEQGSGDATVFEYGPQSALFEGIRQHTTFIDGLPIARPGGDSHVAAQVHFMTGGAIPADGAEMSHYPSIDQILARQSPLFSGALAAPSVTWSGHTQGDGLRAHIHILSFDDAVTPQPIFPQNSPLLAYKSLFAGFMPNPSGAEQEAELALALKQNKSVLDYTKASVERLSARVSAAEKVRLETHLQALRELELRFAAPPPETPPPSGIMLPDEAALEALVVNDTEHHQAVLENFLALAKSGFGFDRTRVATLMLASGHNWVNMKHYVPELSQSGGVHEITHLNYEGKNLDMRLITDWYGKLLNEFVLDLAATPESDGSSMLDNTLIVFFSEVAIIGDGIDAQHDATNTPLAMIGGKNLGNVGGRCLRYQTRTTNDFWTTVGQKLGLGEDFVMGNPADNHGLLSELFV
ncbi:MAG TPA: DUF1552 domain-containing protein [Polyangiaceae bacterium]|nr:DUF1552 domain-containing protein [Polyangiaceae bacterium]